MRSNRIIKAFLSIVFLLTILLTLVPYVEAMPPPRSFKWFTFGSGGGGGGVTAEVQQTLLSRETYSDSSRTKKQSTFENGETAYVRLIVSFNQIKSEKIKVTDEVTNLELSSVKSSRSFVGSDIGDGSKRIVFELNGAKRGENIIDYEYKVAD